MNDDTTERDDEKSTAEEEFAIDLGGPTTIGTTDTTATGTTIRPPDKP
jgi:hypothetical protein